MEYKYPPSCPPLPILISNPTHMPPTPGHKIYAPENGNLILATILFDRHKYEITCCSCQGTPGRPGFIKDEGGKPDGEGRSRRRWFCQKSNTRTADGRCQSLSNKEYILRARSCLTPADFGAALDSAVAEPDSHPTVLRSAWSTIPRTPVSCPKRKAIFCDEETSPQPSKCAKLTGTSPHPLIPKLERLMSLANEILDQFQPKPIDTTLPYRSPPPPPPPPPSSYIPTPTLIDLENIPPSPTKPQSLDTFVERWREAQRKDDRSALNALRKEAKRSGKHRQLQSALAINPTPTPNPVTVTVKCQKSDIFRQFCPVFKSEPSP